MATDNLRGDFAANITGDMPGRFWNDPLYERSVPIEFIGADAEGHVIDTRDGERLVASGAVSWPERFNGCPECHPQGQGWYHPAALIPPGYGGQR